MKNILLLTTGGTIACQPGSDGLEPQSSRVLGSALEPLGQYYRITVQDIMCLDSSNIRPAEWQSIAETVYREKDRYDGIVISHGTDTMAYTASAVTFMLPGLDKPVVFTGSQLPLGDPLSDGPDNLRTAFAMAASGKAGVFVAFDRKVMLGCRAVKVRASDFAAFESVNSRYVATVTGQGLTFDPHFSPVGVDAYIDPRADVGIRPYKDLCTDVFLLKLTPGLSPAIFDALSHLGYKGIVIEAFGLGGMNVLDRGLQGIEKAVKNGISVVVTTQCLYDSADLQVYQVGNKLLQMGVIEGRDMTSEAAMTKLMWALGQGMTQSQIAEIFKVSLAGEITV